MHREKKERLGYINGTIEEPSIDYPKHADCESNNLLVMAWLLNSMESSVSQGSISCLLQRRFDRLLKNNCGVIYSTVFYISCEHYTNIWMYLLCT